MKNLSLLFAIGLTLFTSCTKDESYQPIEEQTSDSIYVLNQFEGSSTWETMSNTDLPISNNSTYANNTTTAHSEGYFMPTSRDAMTIEWSGTQNERGVFGTAQLIQSTPNYSFHFVLETECVMVDGNEAVYGATITHVRARSGNVPAIDVGWRFYFKVIDQDRTNRSDFDQIANTTFFASPRSPSLCGVYLPNNRRWSSQGYTDIARPGFVVVSN